MIRRQPQRVERPVGDPTPSYVDKNGNLPGHSPILAVVNQQFRAPELSTAARVFGYSPLAEDSRPFFDAAVSDAEVGVALARMGEEWTAFHSFPVGAGIPAVGHLLIGPGGVFVVGTRSHAGQTVRVSQRTFLIAEVRHPYIREMEFEMGLVERLLTDASGLAVEVGGVIAVVASRSITVEQKHRDVAVLDARSLTAWLNARPRVLSDIEIGLIVRAAEQAGTWEQVGQPGDARELHADFTALRKNVRSAWRIQLAWTIVAIVVGVAGVVYLVSSVITVPA